MGLVFEFKRDTAGQPNLDGVGIFWLLFASLWTLLLLAGMAFLIHHRKMPLLRIRRLSLSITAVMLLHLYWFIVQLVYVTGSLWPNGVEYWIMSIYLPFGIALFHASNSLFIHVAKGQERFVKPEDRPARRTNEKLGFVEGFRKLKYSTRILMLVFMGMVIQLVLTLIMYLVSRKFHPSFGFPGTETHGTPEEQRREAGRGWEWWPSVFWQFFWAWLVAPVILWRARRIHDTMGWRTQTIACCFASLHATPMWLVALYVDAMAPVNRYFVPPQWIAISIMVIEIFTIFLPCWEVLRHQSLRQETLDTIAQWESRKHAAAGNKSVVTDTTIAESAVSTAWRSLITLERGSSIDSSSAKSVLTMDALEYALQRNPEPLQTFSALQDFSGENIAFLTSVAQWKSTLPQSPRIMESWSLESRDETNQERTRDLFNRALRIYTEFVSILDAEFPINLSFQDLRKLEAIFEEPARLVCGGKAPSSPATPFDTVFRENSMENAFGEKSPPFTPGTTARAEHVLDRVQYFGDIPKDFDKSVFDDAEMSIKYLVLTNTWPKFVRDRSCYTSMTSVNLAASRDSLPEKIGAKCKAAFHSLSSFRTRSIL